ncbi:hypothetical protein TWF694_009929 [Orbilia ellipsospora]|uniref:Fungal N-terminal domain-containing protein n=1 Tax=Orbilia ellipsospora TaxID=2528407 RepID=A0AAV9XCT6_9PEZI
MAMPIQIGDVIALANMCYGIAQAFGSGRKAAPVEFREVQNELYGLGQMLELLKTSVESGAFVSNTMAVTQSGLISPTHQASQSIARMITSCQATVEHLKEFARKYAPLAGVQFIEDDSGVRVRKLSSTNRQKLLLNWKRIRWVAESSNIQGIRDQISIHVQSITAVVSIVNTHATKSVQSDVHNLARYAEGHRMDLQGARAEIYGVHMGVSDAKAGISSVSAGLHMVQQEIQQNNSDIQSLNKKIETIMLWQQRDMPVQELLQQQLSSLLGRIEQLERMPPAPRVQPSPPPSAGATTLLPYPLEDGMPSPYGSSTSIAATTFYQSSNNLAGGSGPASARGVLDYSFTTVVELPASTPIKKGRAESLPSSMSELPSQTVRRISPMNSKPVEIGVQLPREADLPARGSRNCTATDIVFELCLEIRVKDGVAEFKTLCANARFHGNWTKATIEAGEYNEGLFACLCEPFEHEDEDFEPHAKILESYFLTNATVGCHYHGSVQWILHNVGDFHNNKPATLGIRNLSIQNEMKFERTFIEPIALRTAKAIVKGETGNYFAFQIRDETDGDQVAILNSMADDSFSAYLESVTFFVENAMDGSTQQIMKENIKHTNLLHYKMIGVQEIEHSGTWKRDALKYSEYVEMLVNFGPSESGEQVNLLKFHLDEVNLESNNSHDDCVVNFTMTRGEATLPGRSPQLGKVSGVAEFRFANAKSANEFLLRQKNMSDELHWLKIQHAKRNEHVMVKLFADHIEAAANDVYMKEVELVVVWDQRRNRGRILARSRDGSCYLSQTLHADVFQRFEELSRGDLFGGSAEFYRPTNKPDEKVKKYPGGVGRIQFKDSQTDNMFYARLTESAQRFGFIEPKTRPEAPKLPKNPDDKPILQRRISHMSKPQDKRYSEERHRRPNTETVALEPAIPEQNLTRPLDAEELLDLLNQAEEKSLYNMEEPNSSPNIKESRLGVPAQSDINANGDDTVPSLPGYIWTAEELEMKLKDRIKAREQKLNTLPLVDAPGEKVQLESVQDQDDSQKVLPRTAQTTPGLLSPGGDSNYPLRKTASFDTIRSKRESEKVLIPPDATGLSVFEPLNSKHRRSNSTSGPQASQTFPNFTGRSSELNIVPGESISDRPIIQSPDNYNSGDRDDVFEPLNPQISSYDDAEGEPSPRNLPSSLDLLYTESEEFESAESTRLSSLSIIKTSHGIRAYWLTAMAEFGKLPRGTLVWCNESDIQAKKFELGVQYLRVQSYEGGPSAWVSKKILRQGRYYAMKNNYKFEEDGEKVKLRPEDIMVPLKEDTAGEETGTKIRVAHLTEKYTVSVERDWIREINLTI